MKPILVFTILLLFLEFTTAQKVDIYKRPLQHERSRDFDAIHYKITLDVDLEKKMLSGVNQITFSPLNDNFDKCVLDASYLVVKNVINSDGKSLAFEQKNDQVFIVLGRQYKHGDTIRLSINYILDKPAPGLKFIEATATNPLMVSSDCFPNKARQWIPCYDYPNDKVTIDMIVTVDKKYKVLSNGKLVSVKENDSEGTVTYHWNQDLPHSTYLINLSIADYAVLKDSLGSLPINYWIYKGLEADAKTTFRKTPYMINFYSKLYNYSYPWAKYDQVITSYMGGGAEATSATILGEGIIMDTIAEKDFSREVVIAHEIAHQWWGDLITLRSWEHTWLNESFGTYSDYLYTKFDKGEDAGAFDLLVKKNQYLNEAHNRYIRPIVFDRYNDPGDNFDSHTYPKGACMLHLLRYILGDDSFFRTLSTFLHENEFKPVDTHDFMKTIKEVTGKNMDWFFDQYIFSPGHPVFEVTKTWDETKKILNLTVLQKQDSISGVPVYTIPVNLGFVVGGKKIVKEVWLKNKVESFDFEFASQPQLVRFDEGNYLLKEITFKKSLPELLYQAENDDMIGRLTAVNELQAFSSDQSSRAAWARIATHDSFWAVRQAALENTRKYPDKNSVQLFRLCLKDENSKVRLSAIRLLGDMKDPAMIKLFENTFRSENSYAVKAESLRSIGKCGGTKQISFLRSAVSERSYRNVVGKAATDAINMIIKK